MEKYGRSITKHVKDEKQQYYIKGYDKGYIDGWCAGVGGFLIALCFIKFILILLKMFRGI